MENRAARTGGYTLIELMMVVAITGVLAGIAMPAFSGYVGRSRVSEAAAFLGTVKLRQTSYRAEFGQYAGGFQPNASAMVWVPAGADVMRDGVRMTFPPAPAVLGTQPEAPFYAIGARPDGHVRFGYAIAAGDPQQASSGATNLTGPPYNLPATELDYYFIAQATADLDGDGQAMLLEVSSFARDIWSSDTEDGWD